MSQINNSDGFSMFTTSKFQVRRNYAGPINRCIFTLSRRRSHALWLSRHFSRHRRDYTTPDRFTSRVFARFSRDNSPSRTQPRRWSIPRVNSATYFAFAFSAPNTWHPILNRGHAIMQLMATRICRAREGANRVFSPRSFLSSATFVHNI